MQSQQKQSEKYRCSANFALSLVEFPIQLPNPVMFIDHISISVEGEDFLMTYNKKIKIQKKTRLPYRHLKGAKA